VFLAVGEEEGTLQCLKARYGCEVEEEEGCVTRLLITPNTGSETATTLRSITLIRMDNVSGSSEAVKACLPHINPRSSVVILPSDLCLEGGGVLGTLVHHHRMHNRTADTEYGYEDGGGGGEGKGNVLVGCTMLLSDVGEDDATTGLPLKESAKQKKGSLSREEEEIEYVALSSIAHSNGVRGSSLQQPLLSYNHRLLFKHNKTEVEDLDAPGRTSETPKLRMPKSLLRGGECTIRTDLSDLHVYVLSPWVCRLIETRATQYNDLQSELLQLLIRRQDRGVAAAFGSRFETDMPLPPVSRSLPNDDSTAAVGDKIVDTNKEKLDANRWKEDTVYNVLSALQPKYGSADFSGTVFDDEITRQSLSSKHTPTPVIPYVVSASIIPRGARLAMRCSTISHYLFASTRIVSHLISPPPMSDLVKAPQRSNGVTNAADQLHQTAQKVFSPTFEAFSKDCTIESKFQSVILPLATIGEKCTIRSSTVGSATTIGSKCRFNNVIIHNNATIGSNTVLQNLIVGEGAKIGDNCSLNDVQIGPGGVVPVGSKLKGESVVLEEEENNENDRDLS